MIYILRSPVPDCLQLEAMEPLELPMARLPTRFLWVIAIIAIIVIIAIIAIIAITAIRAMIAIIAIIAIALSFRRAWAY